MTPDEETEVWVCTDEELKIGDVRTAHLGHDRQGLPIMALVTRDRSGVVRAYRNLCRHLPVPLDGGTGELLTEDGAHLVCGTHGAIYRIHDGYCIEGPCEGLALHPLQCHRTPDGLYIRVTPPPQNLK
ncbi:MAG: Rieske (2Fe-2S) protein [Myxococcota bacterium]